METQSTQEFAHLWTYSNKLSINLNPYVILHHRSKNDLQWLSTPPEGFQRLASEEVGAGRIFIETNGTFLSLLFQIPQNGGGTCNQQPCLLNAGFLGPGFLPGQLWLRICWLRPFPTRFPGEVDERRGMWSHGRG